MKASQSATTLASTAEIATVDRIEIGSCEGVRISDQTATTDRAEIESSEGFKLSVTMTITTADAAMPDSVDRERCQNNRPG